MNAPTPYRVRIVVDPVFGERLASFPGGEPVWIVDSAQNRKVVERLWKERPAQSHLTGITIFQPSSGRAEDELLSVLSTVDEHHGVYSADPPYSILEIIGCPVTERVSAALREIGFSFTESTPDGFRARSD